MFSPLRKQNWLNVKPLSPIMLSDLEMGVLIQYPGTAFGFQVPNETDMRHIHPSDIYVSDNGALVEIPATYEQADVEVIFDKLSRAPIDFALSAISVLEHFGFSIEYELLHTLTGDRIIVHTIDRV